MDLISLNHKDGADNTSGIAQKIYVAKLSDIETLPKPVVDDSASDSGTVDQLVTISSDIVMKAGKSFKELYVTLETGKVDDAVQGELDGKSFRSSISFFHPGTSAEQLGFAQYVKNGNFVVLVPELDGNVRVIGHEAYPAKIENIAITTGGATTERKGGTYTAYSVRKGPAPIFTGQVKVSGVGSGVDADGDGNQDITFLT